MTMSWAAVFGFLVALVAVYSPLAAAASLGGAVAMGKEDDHGSLEVGKYADMIVLDRDVTATPLEELHETVVRRTIFNGEVVYEASVDR
jgi:hypothetical protein